MPTNPKVVKAFRAMKEIGITEDKVKPVLKNLLKLYDKKWELIEEENYRVLADAIFEREEAEAVERSKKIADNEAVERSKKIVNNEQQYMDEEAQLPEEPERPLKRLRLRYQEDQASPSVQKSATSLPGNSLIRPKDEPIDATESDLPSHDQHKGMLDLPQATTGRKSIDSQSVSGQSPPQSKGKQAASPNSSVPEKKSDLSQPSAIDKSQQNPHMVAESDSSSLRMRLRDRGKATISPPKRVSSSRSHKEQINDPGVLSPKQKSSGNHALIKPKDEPFTDDLPQLDVPLAVIHPGQLSVDSLGLEDSSRENDYPGPLALQSGSEGGIASPSGVEKCMASKSEAQKDDSNGLPASNGKRSNSELPVVSGESSSNLEIAFGEVKFSLSCDLALGRSDFHLPSLDAVLKLTEDKWRTSYKFLDPNISAMTLMKDMCECFLKLCTESSNESPKTIDVTPAIDLLKQSSAADTFSRRSSCFDSFNGPVGSRLNVGADLPQVIRFPPCNAVEDSFENDGDKEDKDLEDTNCRSLVVVEQRQLTSEMIRSIHDVIDIAKGQERVVITLVNEVNNESPPSFYYIPQNAVFQNAYVSFSLARIEDNSCCSNCSGDCLASPTPCACAHETGGEFAYTPDGLVKEEFLKECISMNRDPKKHCQYYCKECPLERSKNEDIIEPCKGHLIRKFVKECWLKCGCNKQCGNRVVQRGISRKLQVFMSPDGKGWGLRTLEDLPKGAFVCEYVGEILTNAELFDRVSRSPKGEGHSYPVLLDADWGAEGALKDEDALCLDATRYGNVGRFINHRCFDSNMVEIPVEVETPDHHYYHLAFFTTRKVKAMEELTWDYGIDFDDHDHPVKAFRCQCGSKYCRNIKRSTRSRSSSRR